MWHAHVLAHVLHMPPSAPPPSAPPPPPPSPASPPAAWCATLSTSAAAGTAAPRSPRATATTTAPLPPDHPRHHRHLLILVDVEDDSWGRPVGTDFFVTVYHRIPTEVEFYGNHDMHSGGVIASCTSGRLPVLGAPTTACMAASWIGPSRRS